MTDNRYLHLIRQDRLLLLLRRMNFFAQQARADGLRVV